MEKLKNKLDNLRFADYIRKSSRDGEKQVLSIEGQVDDCNNFRVANKLPKALRIYTESRSAKYANKRAGFSEMLTLIQSGDLNAILCWHLNRIARNMTEGGILIDLLSEGKLVIITTNGDVYDETSDMGVVAQLFGASKQYSVALSRDVKRGQRDKARNYGLPQGLATIGFTNSKQGEKGERWWFVDEDRYWKVKKLLETFLTGRYSIGKLHKYAVDELNFTTPKHKKLGGRLITREYLGKLLHNPVLAGFFFVQGERYSLTQKLPRIITESEHNKIKQILGNRFNGKSQKHNAIYSGFIRSETGDFISQDIKYQLWCDCRHKFAYRDKKNCPKCDRKIDELENPEYFIQSYYYNNSKKKKGLEYASVREDKITSELSKHIEENIQIPTPLLDWAKRYIHEVQDQEVIDNLHKTEDTEKRKLKYEESKRRATKLFIDGSINEDEKKDYLNNLEAEYSDLKVKKVDTVNWLEKLDEIIDLVGDVSDLFQNGTYEAKRSLLTQLGANIVWDDKNLSIYNRNSINVLVLGIKSHFPNYVGFGKEKSLALQGLSSDFDTSCISLRKW